MSRYCGESDDGDLPAVFWEIDLHRALTSGRGQRILRDILAALIAMPTWRLAYGEVVALGGWTEDGSEPIPGDVCAVGAYAAWQRVKSGMTWAAALADLVEDGWLGEHDEWDTQQLGQSAGLAKTVAWTLGWLNDERYADLTPEGRWYAVFGWVWNEINVERMEMAR